MSQQFEVLRAKISEATEQQFLVFFDDIATKALFHPRLMAGIRHAVLGGGKRFRATLVFMGGLLARGAEPTRSEWIALERAAAAFELLHAYSLVHDDLPDLDNSPLRRGKPSVHKAFDPATALLVGDALQALAFQMMSPALASNKSIVMQGFSIAAFDMVDGQMRDIAAEGRFDEEDLSLQDLKILHSKKTGAIIANALTTGYLLTAKKPEFFDILHAFGHALGLVFQITDDILDAEGTTEQLGKTAGHDAARNKPTFVTLCGIKGARAEANAIAAQALDLIKVFGGEKDLLASAMDYVQNRTR
jgi:geranylgeranyl pyrophosphate synthase